MRLYHLENYQRCGVYRYHCVALSRGKVLKLRSIYIIVWLYHVEKYQSCGVYISLCGYIMWKSIKLSNYIDDCAAISRGKRLKLRSIYIILRLYHVEKYQVAKYIYHCAAISSGKVLKLRCISIIVRLYDLDKY